MYLRQLLFPLLTILLLAACGGDREPIDRRPGSGAGPVEGVLPVPGDGSGGEAGEDVTDTTEVVLLGPAVPDDANVVALRARLVNQSTRESVLIESTHPGFDQTGAAATVTPGTYTLTYLDENGAETGFTQRVTVLENQRTEISIGSVRISPASAVIEARQGTQSPPYEISTVGEGILKIVDIDLNTVVDVPPRQLEWAAIGINGALAPLALNAGTGLINQELGSVFLQRNPLQDVFLESASGVLLFSEMVDGVEYLLPATPQEQGCMVYFGVVNNLTTHTITLCSDAVDHVVLDAR